MADSPDSSEGKPRVVDRSDTLSIGGVGTARSESQRTIMPSAVRKHAYLSLASGSKKYAEILLSGDETIIGRGPGVDLVLEEPSASRRHAAIIATHDGYVLRDLNSTNGTYLHGVLNDEERLLEDGDCFRIGGTEIVFHAGHQRL